jgi:hypothetical protein
MQRCERRLDEKLRLRGIGLACVLRVGGRVHRLQRVVSGEKKEEEEEG